MTYHTRLACITYHRHLALSACFLLAGILLASCSGSSVVTPGVPAVKPSAGPFAFPAAAGGLTDYGLMFVVEQEDRNEIAAYQIFCSALSSQGVGLNFGPFGTAVAIHNGRFVIDGEDVLLSGEFVDPVTIQGTIEARSDGSTRCGIPNSGTFVARCGNPFGINYYALRGKEFTVDASVYQQR